MSEIAVTCPPFLLSAVESLDPMRTAVVNAGTAVVMQSAKEAAEAGIITPVLFGDPIAITALAGDLNWDLSGVEIIAADTEATAASLAAAAAGAGDVSALMKGHIHTDVFLRAVLNRSANLRTERRLTHLFMMTSASMAKPLFISDAALNAHPDEESLKAIIANAVETALAIGINRPKVALLSATEEPNKAVPSSLQAQNLSAWAATALPQADVVGPLAFDLAVSSDAAEIKGVSNPVAGQADAIIVPDIVSGNALFKSMVHYQSACAAGLVLGARVPVLLTSRADPPAARLASAALARIVLQSPTA